jgi:hypothetical protein
MKINISLGVYLVLIIDQYFHSLVKKHNTDIWIFYTIFFPFLHNELSFEMSIHTDSFDHEIIQDCF